MARGRKSSLQEKLNKGTANATREKAAAAKAQNASPEVADYLSKTKAMLDLLWAKLNDAKIQDNAAELDKYSRLFILWQKHYFQHLSFVPKSIQSEGVISELISNKDL